MTGSDWAGVMIPALRNEFGVTAGRATRLTNLVRWLISRPEFEGIRERGLLDEEFNETFTNELVESLRDQPEGTLEERWNNLVKEFGLYDELGEEVLLTSTEPSRDDPIMESTPPSQKFLNDEGDVLNYRQIGYIAWNEGTSVERTEDGLLIDGVLYQPLDDHQGAGQGSQISLADYSDMYSRAQALKKTAQADPSNLDFDEILDILETPTASPTTHAIAAQTLLIASYKGREIDPRFVNPVVTLLDRPSLDADALLLRVLREITQNDPDAVMDVRDRLFQDIEVDETETTKLALQCCTELAANDPSSVLDLAPKLSELVVSENREIRLHASYILARIARDHPMEVKPASPKLAELISSDDDIYQTNGLAVLGHLTSYYPPAGQGVAKSISAVTDSPSPKVRANAVGIMADLARNRPGEINRHRSVIEERLHDSDETVRANAVSVILHIGLNERGNVEDTLPDLVELIDDPSPIVRRNVARTLGYLETSVAIEQLRSLAESDPDEGVQDIATWAITRITN